MPDPRLVAVITALLMLAGTAPVRAAYDLAQLQQIEDMILRKDSAALWEYLVANPSIMAGDDALALELRLFVAATERGALNFFAVGTTASADTPSPRWIEPY